MKLRVANKCVLISPTPEIHIIFTAVVLPLSTFIVDEGFSLSAASHTHIHIYVYSKHLKTKINIYKECFEKGV